MFILFYQIKSYLQRRMKTVIPYSKKSAFKEPTLMLEAVKTCFAILTTFLQFQHRNLSRLNSNFIKQSGPT